MGNGVFFLVLAFTTLLLFFNSIFLLLLLLETAFFVLLLATTNDNYLQPLNNIFASSCSQNLPGLPSALNVLSGKETKLRIPRFSLRTNSKE